MLCADENFFPWIDICAIQINKIIIIIIKSPPWPGLGGVGGGGSGFQLISALRSQTNS